VWHIFRGTWLVIEINAQWSVRDEQCLRRALDTRVFDGFNKNSKPFRLAVPRDFRVILVSSPDSEAVSGVPCIDIDASQTALSGYERWNTYLSEVFGSPSGLTEVQYRSRFLEAFSSRFLWLQLENPATIGEGERLLGTAYSIGGESSAALSTAIDALYGASVRGRIEGLNAPKDLNGMLSRLLEDEQVISPRQKIAAIELWAHLSNGASTQDLSALSPRDCFTHIVKHTKPNTRGSKGADALPHRA
jgi:hypothetical protein